MIQETFSEHHMQLIEIQKEHWERFVKNLPPHFNDMLIAHDAEKFMKAQEEAESYAKGIRSFYAQTIEKLAKQLSGIEDVAVPGYLQESIKTIERIQIEHEQIPPVIKESMKAMMDYGWYPDINSFAFRALIEFKKETIESSIDDINGAFVEYYKNELSAIKDQLYTKYPKRKEIFQAAFEAHENGNYLLSVPVFLTQIDGIAIDEFEYHFFMKKDKNPKTALALKAIQGLGEFSLALLIPLQLDQPIMHRQDKRNENFTGLNRHQVLHGEVVDYGTEINSYKTISLLLYISQASKILSTHNGDN
jgi:hypothetical protein